VSEWQPIATAPKAPEGEAVVILLLGFAADEEGYAPLTREGFWLASLQRWSSSLDPGWSSSPQPTHWMPLPDPPKETK